MDLPRLSGWLWTWVLLLAGFVALGVLAGKGVLLEADLAVSRWVQSWPGALGPLSDAANAAQTPAGFPIIALAIAVCLARRQPLAALAVLGVIIPRLIQYELKLVFDVSRPSSDLVQVLEETGRPSYPSGHVVGVTALCGVLYALSPRVLGEGPVSAGIRFTCAFLVLWIGVARIWTGAHWLSDTIGGYMFAALYLIPVLRLLPRPRPAR